MCIQDNGKGIDLVIFDGGCCLGYWGLVGMCECVIMLYGQFSIGVGDIGGVLIILLVFVGIVYVR